MIDTRELRADQNLCVLAYTRCRPAHILLCVPSGTHCAMLESRRHRYRPRCQRWASPTAVSNGYSNRPGRHTQREFRARSRHVRSGARPVPWHRRPALRRANQCRSDHCWSNRAKAIRYDILDRYHSRSVGLRWMPDPRLQLLPSSRLPRGCYRPSHTAPFAAHRQRFHFVASMDSSAED